MGIPLDIFTLYQLQRGDSQCQHYLLLRVEQAEFNNADEGHYNYVVAAADTKRNALIEVYQAKVLANECPGLHTIQLVGELQSYPVGDTLCEEYGGFSLDLWVAETRYGYPWVVLGMAENEAKFWREVEQDHNLAHLGALKPAKRQRTYFLTENGYATDKAN